MQKTTSLITAVCAAMLAPALAFGVPLQVAHQGEVEDSNGPVTATLEFTFSLYDAAEDGNEVWSEDRSIDVVDGDYSVLLGSETAIDSVLFVEPALYLQIAIEDGEPLLPRQPVASAPYAVVAHTAENLSGGSVDASSISVNGTSVVNSEGDWIGPAGSIDWSAVTGAPADSDTLGGLSCADGDRAVWNDSSTQWECGSSLVSLDRLDVAGASSGQVLTYDGGAAAWTEAGSTGSGCVVVSTDGTFAELDCGGTSLRLTVQEEYVDLINGNVRLRADGTLKDWTGLGPSGTFASVWGRNTVNCAIDPLGAATCWGTAGTTLNPIPAGAYQQIECWTEACCGILTSGALTCWNSYGSTPQPVESGVPGGTFIDLVVSGSKACALNLSGAVQCWGSSGSAFQANAPAGSGLQRIGQIGGYICAGGPTAGGCFSDVGAATAYTVPLGDYVQIQDGLGLLSNGDVVHFLAGGAVISHESFLALGKADGAFGVTADGRVLSVYGAYQVPGP